MKRWAGIARFGGIGDNLVAASPLYILKKLGYSTEVMTSPPNHVVFINNPHIDKLSVHEPDKDFPQGDLNAWQKYFEARAKTFDVFGHFSHSMEGRHAVFRSMTSFWWAAEYRRKICAGSYLETAHDIMGVPYEFDKLFYPDSEEKERAMRAKEELGGRFVSWVLNGSRIDKVYPFAPSVIARVIKELKVPVVLHGGANEKDRSMAMAIQEYVRLQNSSTNGIISAITRDGAEENGKESWPIRRTLTLAGVADCVVSPDTGVAWSVAFEPVPKVILISHASVENITKHWVNTISLHADQERVPCWPCHQLHDTPDTCVANEYNNGAKCISDITVDVLFETIKKQLNERADNVVPLRATA